VRSIAILACAALAALSCGAPPAAEASPSPTSSAAPSSAAPVPGGLTFTVTAGSKATVKVREQLADVKAPSDAVLVTNAVTGSFTLLPDGTFAPGSKITVDLRTLKSDRSQRDQFIQRNPLETSRFPNAEFVPQRATGLTLPLAATGDLVFGVAGAMTIHGVTKDVTCDVTATRTATGLTATATNAAAPWTFGEFGMSRPSVFVVVSIVDRIDVEIDLVATQSG
jgi:polyisoprenoid-binding protein YceI